MLKKSQVHATPTLAKIPTLHVLRGFGNIGDCHMKIAQIPMQFPVGCGVRLKLLQMETTSVENGAIVIWHLVPALVSSTFN